MRNRYNEFDILYTPPFLSILSACLISLLLSTVPCLPALIIFYRFYDRKTLINSIVIFFVVPDD